LNGSVHTIKKNVKALVAASKIGLEVNVDKLRTRTRSSLDKNAGKITIKRLVITPLKGLAAQYLGTILKNQNSIQEEIMVCRSIVLPVVLYGCETWSLALRDKRRIRVLESRVLGRIFRPKRDEITGGGENYIIRSLIICTLRQLLFGCSYREE